MSGTVTAHPNSQGTAPQQTGVVPGQMQQQRAQSMYLRQNVVHPFQNLAWSSHNAMNIANSAPQVNAGFQTAPVSSVPYLPPTAAYGLTQQAIMRATPVNVTYPFPATPAQAQYNMQQPQQMYMQSTGNANFAPYAGQRPIYFQQVIPQMPSNRNGMPPIHPQQATQQQTPVSNQRRERKPIRVQDPVTLEDINFDNELENSEHSSSDFPGTKKDSQIEPVPTDLATTAIGTRIQFAQQVSALAILRKETHKEECIVPPEESSIIPPVLPEMKQGIILPPPVHSDVILEQANNALPEDTERDMVNNNEYIEEVPEYALGTPVPANEVADTLNFNGINQTLSLEENESFSTDFCAKDATFQEGEIEETTSKVIRDLECQDEIRTSSPSPPPAYQEQCVNVLPTPPVPPTSTLGFSVDNTVFLEKSHSANSFSLPISAESSLTSDSCVAENGEAVQENKVEIERTSHQNGDISSSTHDSGSPDVRNTKLEVRNINELNGEIEEKNEVEMAVKDSSEVLPERDDDDEELRKVAEKNQENTRVSGQQSEVPVPPVIEVTQPTSPVLKYDYKEDQWSPLNPEGKKQYDRAFLLNMQSQPISLKKPEGLPNLDVIKEKAIQFKLRDHTSRPAQTSMQPIHRGNQPDFMPSYAHGGSPRPPQGGGNRRPSQQSREKPKKIINISTSWSEDVKLHSSENAWKPASKTAPENESEEEAKTMELYKKVRGILNKLTPQKFQTLVEQVKDMKIDTEERLKGVIDLVFEKAVDEPNFSVPYANMCKQLAMKAVPSGQNNQIVNFRKLLLTKCQKEFESDARDEIKKAERLKEIAAEATDKKKQLLEELEEEFRKSRRRSLGNIKFIGELYKLGMLVTPIMHDCLKKLLKAQDEDSLECLCRLLTTVGKELDTDKKSDNSAKGNQFKGAMDDYFGKLKKVVDNRNTSSRVRFMIQDVIELRLNKWVPRRIENNPKTIDQIHMEAEREAQEQQILNQQPLPQTSNRRPDDRDRRKNRSMQGSGYDDGGWNTVGNKSRGSASFNYDPNKGTPKLVSKPLETDSIQLGPSNRTWSRGSSGGTTRMTNQDSDSKSNFPTNRYQALANHDSESRRTLHQSPSSSREHSRSSQGGTGSTNYGKTSSQSRQSTNERDKAAAKSFFDPSSTENVVPNSRISAPELNKTSAEPKEPVPPKPVVPDATVSVSEEYKLIGHDMDFDQMTKRATPIIEEYLHNNDLKEALQCIIELASPNSIEFFVTVSVNCVLERSNKARAALGLLLRELLAKRILNLDQMCQGLESIFEVVMDLEIDIPKVWQYLGEILLPLVEDSTLTLVQLRKPVETCIQQNCGGKFFSSLLHVMEEHLGQNKVKQLWDNSALQWTDVLSKDEDLNKFLAANKLEFTISGVGGAPAPTGELTIEQFKLGLDNLLKKKDSSNKDITDWIETKMETKRLSQPNFIRALVTSVTESAIEEGSPGNCDYQKIKDRSGVLTKYVANNQDLELQALYALQALDNRLQHPKGMLVRLFEAFYDEDVITEEAFGQWEKSTDPAEAEGKGVALKSVTSFFRWLTANEDGEGSAEEN